MTLSCSRSTHSSVPARTAYDDLTRRALLGGLAGVAAAASGCGAEDMPTTQAPTTHEVDDFLGATTIPQHPDRVVADSASTFANLVALGVEPVAVAVPTGISTSYFWSGSALPSVTADDGWSINVEKALALRPDLILAVGADWNEENVRSYKEAVATYAFVEGWKDISHITERFLALGSAIGREDEAMTAIGRLAEKTTDAAAAIRPHLPEIGTAGVVRFGAEGFIGVRAEELASAVLQKLGVAEPQWPEVGESGYVELSLETLDVLERADTLFITVDDELDPADVPAFNSRLWELLEPVKAGRAHAVSAWNGVDVLQLGRMVDDIVAAVVP